MTTLTERPNAALLVVDVQNGVMDGTPELDDSERYSAWSRVAGEEYAELHTAVEHHRKTNIDPYGATNGPEFFAVVVEAFFEKPLQLERQHPGERENSLYASVELSLRPSSNLSATPASCPSMAT